MDSRQRDIFFHCCLSVFIFSPDPYPPCIPFVQPLCDLTSQCFLFLSYPLLPNQISAQEPGPAKVTVTSSSSGGGIPCLPSSIASAERVPISRASIWQEESRWSRTTIPCSRSTSCISQLSQSHPDPCVTYQDGGDRDIGISIS